MNDCGAKDNRMKDHGLPGGAGGFSLVELITAMTVGLVVLGAMYNVFAIQNKTFTNQEEIVAMQQNVRAGIDMMAREIGMTGYDPTRVNSDANGANNFSAVTVNASQLQIQADLDGNGVIDTTSQENIIYAFDATDRIITRNIGAGDQPFIENIEGFTFDYLDGSGNVTTNPANVRRIRIAITGRTGQPDPSYAANGGYRTFRLISTVNTRNLDY